MAEYKSKTVVVDHSQMAMFQAFTNLDAMLAAVPEDKRSGADIVVDGDMLKASYAGFTISVRIAEKVQFSKVVFQDVEAPFHFTVTMHFDPAPIITQTTLWISVDADLNYMMRTLLGSKIEEALDQIVFSIANGGLLR